MKQLHTGIGRRLYIRMAFGQCNMGNNGICRYIRQHNITRSHAAQCQRKIRLIESTLTTRIMDNEQPAQIRSSHTMVCETDALPGAIVMTLRTSR